MKTDRKVRQLVLIGAVATAIAAPTAGAASNKYVQIGGDNVSPTQLSAYQAGAGHPVGAHLVQFNGKLVRAEQLSALQAQAGQKPVTASTSGDGGFNWSTTSIELALIGALVFFAGLLGVLWRRGRLSTA
jgi:hypothetical protein